MARYLGNEPATSKSQVVEYLIQNYQDGNEQLMPVETAQALVRQADEQIAKGIQVFRSNVYYLGDEAVKNYGGGVWYELPDPDEEDDDDSE